MATKFYLAEIPDDFPATNVKFENMTKPLLAIPAKMVDGKPITIVGYINAGQKKSLSRELFKSKPLLRLCRRKAL